MPFGRKNQEELRKFDKLNNCHLDNRPLGLDAYVPRDIKSCYYSSPCCQPSPCCSGGVCNPTSNCCHQPQSIQSNCALNSQSNCSQIDLPIMPNQNFNEHMQKETSLEVLDIHQIHNQNQIQTQFSYESLGVRVRSYIPESTVFWRQPTLIGDNRLQQLNNSYNQIINRPNHKPNNMYRGIETASDNWVKLVSEEARISVEEGFGPFASLILRIDRESSEIIEYWKSHDYVVQWNDPTAHAEVVNIRIVCEDLSRRFGKPVFNLGEIVDPISQRRSYCVIYTSCEPNPMCYGAINLANIPICIFACTRYDAAAPGVNFSDLAIYNDLNKPYSLRNNIRIYQANYEYSLDAFTKWKNK